MQVPHSSTTANAPNQRLYTLSVAFVSPSAPGLPVVVTLLTGKLRLCFMLCIANDAVGRVIWSPWYSASFQPPSLPKYVQLLHLQAPSISGQLKPAVPSMAVFWDLWLRGGVPRLGRRFVLVTRRLRRTTCFL